MKSNIQLKHSNYAAFSHFHGCAVNNLGYSKFKDDIVEKYSLLEPVERGSYKCEDIKTILLELDKAIDNFQDESAGIREEERYLQRIILRMFVKLTLIAPAQKSVITSIKKSDITEEYKKLFNRERKHDMSEMERYKICILKIVQNFLKQTFL